MAQYEREFNKVLNVRKIYMGNYSCTSSFMVSTKFT